MKIIKVSDIQYSVFTKNLLILLTRQKKKKKSTVTVHMGYNHLDKTSLEEKWKDFGHAASR